MSFDNAGYQLTLFHASHLETSAVGDLIKEHIIF